MDYVEPGTECRSKQEFAQLLQRWLESDHETVIGEPSSYGGKPLVHVQLGGERFHLNGDTQDQGVEEYLRLVREHGPELPWHVVANQNGTVNKLAFGDPPQPIKRFYLYASSASAAPYSV